MRTLAILAVPVMTALSLTACGSDEGRDGAIVIGGQPTADYTPLYVGMQEGLFEEAGLDLSVVPLTGAGTAVTSLTNRSIDIVDQSPLVAARANQDGSNLRLICGTTDGHWTSVMKKAGSGIPVATDDNWESAVQQWKGLSIGVPTLNGAVHYWVVDILEAAGLSEQDVTFVASGAGESAITTLTSDQVDLLLTFPFMTQTIGDRGEVVFDLRTQGPEDLQNQTNGAWMAEEEWLDENPELAEKFCATMDTAITFTQDAANADIVRNVIGREFGIDGAAADAAFADNGPINRFSTELTCPGVELVLDSALTHNLLAEEPAQSCDTLLWKQRP